MIDHSWEGAHSLKYWNEIPVKNQIPRSLTRHLGNCWENKNSFTPGHSSCRSINFSYWFWVSTDWLTVMSSSGQSSSLVVASQNFIILAPEINRSAPLLCSAFGTQFPGQRLIRLTEVGSSIISPQGGGTSRDKSQQCGFLRSAPQVDWSRLWRYRETL